MVLAKHALQKIFVFYLFSWAALAAVQVQGGLRHGKIQEGEWEKPEKSLAELLLGNTNGFFCTATARPVRPPPPAASTTAAVAATATTKRQTGGSIWLSQPLEAAVEATVKERATAAAIKRTASKSEAKNF